jgi:hypothetical protein
VSEEKSQVFDADAASIALRNMWLELSEAWQERAANAPTPEYAVLWASAAAEAIWIATGESSGLGLKEIAARHQENSNG